MTLESALDAFELSLEQIIANAQKFEQFPETALALLAHCKQIRMESGGSGATNPPIDTTNLAKEQTLGDISEKIDALEAKLEDISANFFSTSTTLENLAYINNLLGDRTDEVAPDSEGFHTLASLIKRISSLLEMLSSGAESSILAIYNFDFVSAQNYFKLELNATFQNDGFSDNYGSLSASHAYHAYSALNLNAFTNQGFDAGININAKIKPPFDCRFSVNNLFFTSPIPDNAYLELALGEGENDAVFGKGSFSEKAGIRLIKTENNLIPACFVRNSPGSVNKFGEPIPISTVRGGQFFYIEISISNIGITFSFYQNQIKKEIATFKDWFCDTSKEYTAYIYATANDQLFNNNLLNVSIADIRQIVFLAPSSLETSVQESPIYNYVSNAGTISAGAKKVYIANVGSANGTTQSKTLPPGISIPFEATQGNTLGAIPYDATGTQFAIVEVR